MTAAQAHRGRSALKAVDAVLFVFAGLSAVWLAYLVLIESLQPNWQLLLLAVFWGLVAYLVLPRIHRALTYIYVPNYFIGRARTSDGRLGDPVNLALLGDEAQVHAAMTAAGWVRADDVTLGSSLRIIRTTVSRRSYPEAPVSPLHLFQRQQDFAYQQEVRGNPSQRHHVRFWRCPRGWRLPGGYAVDWVASGTYDRSVGLSLMTFQVTHRIAKHIDVERDHIVATLTDADPRVRVHQIRHFASGYHARNGGGDEMVTDGNLPVLDLGAVTPSVRAGEVMPVTDSRDRRPASLTFSALVACLRGVLGVALGGLLLADAHLISNVAGPRASMTFAAATAAGLFVVAAVDLGLGMATFHGRNWGRLLLMLDCSATILVAFVATREGPLPTLGSGLPHVALGILVLLALTSPRARRYATRRQSTVLIGSTVVGDRAAS